MTKTKAKTKMPKLPMSPTESWSNDREWDQYNRQMVQYQMEQLERKDAKIAALKRQNKALQREVERLKQKSEKDWKWFSDATGM